MNRLIPLTAIFFSSLVLAATAPAFNELDANKDGVLNQQEITSVQNLNFTEADKNGDGYLDPDEYALAVTEQVGSDPEVGSLDR